MRPGNSLGRVRKLLFCIMSQPKLWEKKRIFFLSVVCINLPLQGWGSCSGNVWLLQITQESVYCKHIEFQQCWTLFGIFLMQHNSHVKLICVSHGSCSIRRKLIVHQSVLLLSQCASRESQTSWESQKHIHTVWYDSCFMPKMVCIVIFPICVLKGPSLIFVWLVPECCWMDLLCKISMSVNLWFHLRN